MITELHSITTADGQTYILNDGVSRWVSVPTPGNLGLPPFKAVTERGYKQNRENEVSLYLQPRTLQITFQHNGCSREEYWQMRAALLDICRPNREGLAVYTFINEARVKRAIQGRIQSPTFAESDIEEWKEWEFNEPIQIDCYDPTFYDPDIKQASFVHTAADPALVFPAAFPIYFDSAIDAYNAAIAYHGTWETFPILIVTGQAQGIIMEHEDLGLFIYFLGTVAVGETLTIDLRNRTVESDLKGNRFTELAPISDLTSWRLLPAPQVSGGVNNIQIGIDGITPETTVTLRFYERYIGI
jgi:hypothetical protein